MPTRTFFDQAFGRDFSTVRVHSDASAAESARAVDARAYTVGQHIVFGRAQFEPESGRGRRLLAHELSHTLQQARVGGSELGSLEVASAHDGEEGAAEAAADRIAHRATSGWGRPLDGDVRPRTVARGAVLQRQSLGERVRRLLPRSQFVDDLLASVREAPQHVGEFLTDEVWAAVKEHWGRILAVTLGLILAEGVIGALEAAPTGVSQIVGAILQLLVLAILGYSAGVELHGATEAGMRWFSLARDAHGDRAQISEASRAFVRMIWHIGMAVLAVAGVRARLRGLRAGAEAPAGRGIGGGPANQAGGGAEVIDLAARRAAAAQRRTASSGSSRPVATEGNLAIAPSPDVVVEVPVPRTVPAPAAQPAPAAAAARVRPGSGVQPFPAAAAGVSSATSAAERRRPNAMRHQIQQGRVTHYSSTAVSAPSNVGVTMRQLRDTMLENAARYMRIASGMETPPIGWTRGPVSHERPIRSGIIRQSQQLPAIVAGGGVRTGGDINGLRQCFDPDTLRASDCEDDDVRLDIENVGHNLRS